MVCKYCGKKFESSEDKVCCESCILEFQFIHDDLKSNNKNFKLCKYCGKPFIVSGTSAFCRGINDDKLHYRACVVCGKPFLINVQNSNKKTCSKECRRISFAKSGEGKFLPKIKKKCQYCGNEFQPNSSRQIFCKGPHFKNCEVCGKPFEIDLSLDAPKTCSEKCRVEMIKITSLERYGETNIFKTKKFKESQKQRNQELYGVDYYQQTQEFKNKFRDISV